MVLCGKGNNGGDGLVVARLLKESGCAPEVFLFSNPGAVEGDAAVNLKRWQQGLGELHVVTSEPFGVGIGARGARWRGLDRGCAARDRAARTSGRTAGAVIEDVNAAHDQE